MFFNMSSNKYFGNPRKQGITQTRADVCRLKINKACSPLFLTISAFNARALRHGGNVIKHNEIPYKNQMP